LIDNAQLISVELFNRGITQNPFVQQHGRIEIPIPVYGHEKDIESWFIGITISDKLVGFIQLNSDFELLRFSSFQRDPTSLDGCPIASSWLDPEYILERSRSIASQDDALEPPFLSYDRNITRLAWKVIAEEKSGHKKTILIAGDFVYLADQS